MGETFLVNEADRPDINKVDENGNRKIPGVKVAPKINTQKNTVTKFLGRETDEGPWVYYKVQKKGDIVPLHRHSTNRTEFLIEGKIEWREKGKEPTVYGAGTLSWVEANTLYG